MNGSALYIWFKSTHAYRYLSALIYLIKWHLIDGKKSGTIFINAEIENRDLSIDEEMVKRVVAHNGDVLYIKREIPVKREFIKSIYEYLDYEEKEEDDGLYMTQNCHRVLFIQKLFVKRFKKMRLNRPIIVLHGVSDFIQDYEIYGFEEKRSLLKDSYDVVMGKEKEEIIVDIHLFLQAMISEKGGRIIYIESEDEEVKRLLKKVSQKWLTL